MPVAPRNTKKTTLVRKPSSSRGKPSPESTDGLANKLAALTLSDSKGKGKAELSDEEKRIFIMREINSLSQSLTATIQSGWKKSHGPKGKTLAAVNSSAAKLSASIDRLRELCRGDIDVERASMSILGKLVTLEMYDVALSAAEKCHINIYRLLNAEPSFPQGTDHTDLLAITLPKSSPSPMTLTLISLYFVNSLPIVLYLLLLKSKSQPNLSLFISAISNSTSLLSWLPLFRSLPSKHLDAVTTRAYSTLNRSLALITHPNLVQSVFSIRVYGLCCLAYTSLESLKADTFWDQVVKLGAAYAKSSTTQQHSEVASCIGQHFTQIYDISQKRPDHEKFMTGKPFSQFCEYWLTLATKSRDSDAMNRIAHLVKNSTVLEYSDSESTYTTSKIYILLTRTTSCLEDAAANPYSFQETTDMLCRKEIVQYFTEEDDQDDRTGGKLWRALERLRRAALAAFEHHTSDGLHRLLHVVMDVMEQRSKANKGALVDIYTQILDTLFILSRKTLTANDAHTHIVSYDYLSRAMHLLCVESDPSENISEIPNRADFIRCLSGALHNNAGVLYQAGRYGSAISFLKDGCRLADLALECIKGNIAGQKSEEGWRQLQSQLHRRWQLLGVCYSKIGDRQGAFAAFIRCIETFPYLGSGLTKALSEQPLDKALDSSSGLRELVNIVDRLSYLGLCELLWPYSQISLRYALLPNHSIVGALLERQVECLQHHRRKEGVPSALAGLLKDAVEVYSGANMYIRKVRVIIRILEIGYYIGPDFFSSLGTPEALAAAVAQSQPQSKNASPDEGLQVFYEQYSASVKLWIALHTHRTHGHTQATDVARHCEEALHILQSLWHSKDSPERPQPVTVIATVHKPLARKRSVRDPVTPKAKPRRALREVTVNSDVISRPTDSVLSFIDNSEKFASVLNMCSHVLQFFGMVSLQIQYLELIRKIFQQSHGSTSDGYIFASCRIVRQLLAIGKNNSALLILEQLSSAVDDATMSDLARTSIRLCLSEGYVAGDIMKSVQFYSQGSKTYLAKGEKFVDLSRHVTERALHLANTASAFHTFSVLQLTRNDGIASLNGLIQSLRLWQRGFEALGRLRPVVTKAPVEGEENPFAAPSTDSSLAQALPVTESSSPIDKMARPNQYQERKALENIEWDICDGLFRALFLLSKRYLDRGSPREAEYFAQQAEDLAHAVNAPAMHIRALTIQAEIKMRQNSEEAQELIERASNLLDGPLCVNHVIVDLLAGQYHDRCDETAEAQAFYQSGEEKLVTLEKTLTKISLIQESDPNVYPQLTTSLLHDNIWLLRDGPDDEYKMMLETFYKLHPSTADYPPLDAKLLFYDLCDRIRSDMYLSSVAESTIAIPIGTSNTARSTVAPNVHEIIQALQQSETLFWAQLLSLRRNGQVWHVRDVNMSLALIRAFQTSLGNMDKESSLLITNLLDVSSSLTLIREYLDVLETKFRPMIPQDDLRWPRMADDGSPLQYEPLSRRPIYRRVIQRTDSADEDDYVMQYWEKVRQRYLSDITDPSYPSSLMATLPSHWTVVHINLTDDRNTLFISRQRGCSSEEQPLTFCVPLTGRRDSNDEENLTFEDALKELEDIIHLSNEGTKIAAQIKNDEAARVQWWKERRDLDRRMKELVENIEFCWLGAFKTILNPPTRHSAETLANFHLQFDKVFQQGLHYQDKKTKEKALGHRKVQSESQSPNRVTLDDALIECFSTLSHHCRDEELEDLIYFMLDLYQFHGIPVAVSDIDITQVEVDLRTLLEEHAARCSRRPRHPSSVQDDEHTFLVLDKNVQGLPWENIPILRGRSVSRIPSVQFLLDRVDMARWKKQQRGVVVPPETLLDAACIDPRKGFYILNPSGDLVRTQSQFQDLLKDIGWNGLTSKTPTEQQLVDALQNNDIVMYFGHNGAEQYIRSQRIRNLSSCAAVMLWGCSSGVLRDMGDFDRIGTPMHYMIAGCPTLVANLWDVTDRDIDRFSNHVFEKIHLNADVVKNWSPNASRENQTSLVKAVATSRDCCKLKYLTGAAPVVYGIPFYL